MIPRNSLFCAIFSKHGKKSTRTGTLIRPTDKCFIYKEMKDILR